MPEFNKRQIREILIGKFGAVCWGCGLEVEKLPHGECHLQLDHINPMSGGGPMRMGNAAILCGPCNNKKGNRITLIELRRKNIEDGRCKEDDLIDLDRVINWEFDMYKRAQGITISRPSAIIIKPDGTVVESPRPPWWDRYDPDYR